MILNLGLGGGFNERGNVEYVEREESDDEYDEVSVNNNYCMPELVFRSLIVRVAERCGKKLIALSQHPGRQYCTLLYGPVSFVRKISELI